MSQPISKMETTAVEWLMKEWPALKYQLPTWLIEQAKAMEKEQIVNAWMATDNELQRIAAEQYYNETYGSKDM